MPPDACKNEAMAKSRFGGVRERGKNRLESEAGVSGSWLEQRFRAKDSEK